MNVKEFRVSATTLIVHFLLINLLIGLYTFPRALIRYFSTRLRIEGDMLVGETGLMKKESMHTRINEHISINVQQGFWGRLFNYGDIRVSTPTGTYLFNDMAKPEDIRQAILSIK